MASEKQEQREVKCVNSGGNWGGGGGFMPLVCFVHAAVVQLTDARTGPRPRNFSRAYIRYIHAAFLCRLQNQTKPNPIKNRHHIT